MGYLRAHCSCVPQQNPDDAARAPTVDTLISELASRDVRAGTGYPDSDSGDSAPFSGSASARTGHTRPSQVGAVMRLPTCTAVDMLAGPVIDDLNDSTCVEHSNELTLLQSLQRMVRHLFRVSSSVEWTTYSRRALFEVLDEYGVGSWENDIVPSSAGAALGPETFRGPTSASLQDMVRAVCQATLARDVDKLPPHPAAANR
jgi:hypothetical protein